MAPTMSYIQIEGIHLPVPQLILGSMMLNIENYDYSFGLLDAYYANGGNAIDLAKVYGPKPTRAVGEWMKVRGNRDRMILIGKGAHHDANGPRMKLEHMEEDLNLQLGWLDSDYFDIFMLHRDDPNTSVGYILESLEALLEAGLCRAIGVSNWSTARIQEANDYSAAHGLRGFVCNSPNLSLARAKEPRWLGCVSVDDAYANWHEQTQLPLLSWTSQAIGFFTGRYSPDLRDESDIVRVYYSEENWERYRRAATLADERGVNANHIALAYVLRQPFPTCALIGPNNLDELSSSMEALTVSLSPKEMLWLDLKTEHPN
ncbi:aldo/keto reductase [Paenibacillus roseipurpureus]|uniref:Aldo/keto reductase n=1 Tax=Paenibacillus roseopurpureus TaxID=2918901 RepID=A0AA96RLA7_9BACL|nr:aldo/keto reductase [Paenibacillus sp. MBLB1832]WNR42952.1 aldo/keto reductase [Paenibacillus sp. MBLB1832]